MSATVQIRIAFKVKQLHGLHLYSERSKDINNSIESAEIRRLHAGSTPVWSAGGFRR